MKPTADELESLFAAVGAHLHANGLAAEVFIGDARSMSVVVRGRIEARDVDAVPLTDALPLCEAIAHVTSTHELAPDWFDDGVTRLADGRRQAWADYPGLRIYAPSLEYVFAMKAHAARPEDRQDLAVLRDRLGLNGADAALALVEKWIPARLLTPKTRFAIAELFEPG
jgi:hypothetical protein